MCSSGDITDVTTSATSGLLGGTTSGNANLTVDVDNSTIEISGSNKVQVKDSGITSAKIANDTILLADLNANACTANQIIKRNAGNTAWECAADDSSGSSSFTTVNASGSGEVTATCSSGSVLFGGCYVTDIASDMAISRSFAADVDGILTGTSTPDRWTCHFRNPFGGDVAGTAYVTCR